MSREEAVQCLLKLLQSGILNSEYVEKLEEIAMLICCEEYAPCTTNPNGERYCFEKCKYRKEDNQN